VIFKGAAEVWCGTEEGTAEAWQEFARVVLVVMSGGDAKLGVWESPGDSQRMSFLSGHTSSVAMCPTGFFLARLQLKHHRAQSHPGLEWHQQHLDLCSLRMWPVWPHAAHL
jgi:hypothetical protein